MNLVKTIRLESTTGSSTTLKWRSQLKSLICTINLIIMMDFVLIEAYCNYEISLYVVHMFM